LSETTPHLRWLKALGLVCVVLLARALLDKLLAVQAGPTVVALWAQYQSLVELIASITLVGLGQGLTVYAARESHAFGQLLRAGTIWGFFISGMLAVAVLALLQLITGSDSADAVIRKDWVALGVAAGMASIMPGLFMAWWQGREQRGRMVLVLATSWMPILLLASGWFGVPDIGRLLSVQLATQSALLVILVTLHWRALWQGDSWRDSPLLHYLGAGLSVGLLSPLSLLWVRAELAAQLSWEHVAQLQALWRLTEWVTGISASVLFLLYLPILARERKAADFDGAYGQLWRVVFRPAAVVLALILAGRVPLLLFLYDERFIMPWSSASLFVLGDILRVAAWLPLLGLFARGRVAAIAWGECLSLPLFALAVTVARADTLELVGVLYALTYLLYFACNTRFLRQGLQRPERAA
jgi:hypothetical protein